MDKMAEKYLKEYRQWTVALYASRSMDTQEALVFLEDAFSIIKRISKPRTILIECEGGVVQNVYGLREGDTYDIADWDDANSLIADDNVEGNREEVQERILQKIGNAKAQKSYDSFKE